MTYKIISARSIEDHVITNIDITLDNGNMMNIDVIHFRPSSAKDIEDGIKNRAITEQAKYDSIQELDNLLSTLPYNEEINID